MPGRGLPAAGVHWFIGRWKSGRAVKRNPWGGPRDRNYRIDDNIPGFAGS
jgi:hypothetical protein